MGTRKSGKKTVKKRQRKAPAKRSMAKRSMAKDLTVTTRTIPVNYVPPRSEPQAGFKPPAGRDRARPRRYTRRPAIPSAQLKPQPETAGATVEPIRPQGESR
jgi:hypothetical protein